MHARNTLNPACPVALQAAYTTLDFDALNGSLFTRLAGVEDDLPDIGPRNQYGWATLRGQPVRPSRKQDARMVGAECELAPGERDHRHGGEDDADHQEDRLRVPDEPQADGQQASSQARALAAGHPVAFFVALWVGQHSLMFYPRQGYRQCPGQGPTRNPLADSTEERRKDPSDCYRIWVLRYDVKGRCTPRQPARTRMPGKREVAF
jgi:hypothetical protein